MSSKAFHHVDLVVNDIDRSLAFYRGLLEPLGWNRVGTIVGERGETVWYIGGVGSAVGLREKQSDSHRSPYDRYALGVHHVAFAVPSRAVVDERHRWLVSSGTAIESSPQEYDYIPGYYAVFFYDPDGIKLELVHVPEG